MCGHECFYDWKISFDNQPQNRIHSKDFNFVTASFIKKTNHFIGVSDDNVLRIYTDNNVVAGQKQLEPGIILKESKLMKNSRHFLTACIDKKHKTSSLRVYKNLKSSSFEYNEFAGHMGEITRLRVNFHESLIFTSGTDGCVIMYSCYGGNEMQEEERELLAEGKMERVYSKVVTMRKQMLQDKIQEMENAPVKLDEAAKKNTSRITDDREFLNKESDTLKNELSAMKLSEQKQIAQKIFELDQLKLEKQHEIQTNEEHKEKVLQETENKYRIELSDKAREIEENRNKQKDYRDNYLQDIERKMKHSEDRLRAIREENEKNINIALSQRKELQDKIEELNKDKVLDDQAMDWLNNKILDVINSNIAELRNGMDDMSVQNKNQIKKLNETIQQKKQDYDNLDRDLRGLKEEKKKGEVVREELEDKKKVNR